MSWRSSPRKRLLPAKDVQGGGESLRACLECRRQLPGEDDREASCGLRGRGHHLDFIQDLDIISDIDFTGDYDDIELYDIWRRRHGHGRHSQEVDAGDGAHWQEAGGDQADDASSSSSCRTHWHEQPGAASATEGCARMGLGVCPEPSRPRPYPPASTGEEPKIFEFPGTDVFEFEEPGDKGPEEKNKHKLIIFRDRASGLTLFEHMQNYSNAWEPTTSDVTASLSDWLATYPAPKWIVADSARYYTSQEMQVFVSRSGIGLTIAPAEAHSLDDGF